MKTNIKLSLLALPALLAVQAGCTKMDDIKQFSGDVTASQLTEAIAAAPGRADALYAGMYSKLGTPNGCGYELEDDFGFIMIAFSSDIEAADLVLPDNNYNWFSVCGDLSSRNADYRNPLIRYKICYDVIKMANDVLMAYDDASEDPAVQAKIGEAHAIRAFAYLNLAPYYQFSYTSSENAPELPCVPLVTEFTEDFTHNGRAPLKDVYDAIIFDLNTAIEKLDGWTRSDKSKIDQQVAYGLRARAYLNMGKYAEAAADAEKAMEGYKPASIEDVSKPFMMDISESNWMWGYDMTDVLAQIYPYATSSAWIRSFPNDGYSAACKTYSQINRMLYDKISSTDVRKGWWVDETLYSPLLEGLKWGDLSGQEIATGTIPDIKEPFDPYTNVKFGCQPIGTTTNADDWCWMRVEEMILIQAEGYAKSGKADKARQILTNFVKTCRDRKYDIAERGLTLEDEIWFQRRVELWGEGFSNNDTRRLNKPLVRFHEGEENNVADAFRFNMPADDGWWLLRFTRDEKNTNYAIVDNTAGTIPTPGQYGELRDGVTD